MAVNETIVTGRKFRKLTDAASKKWQRISFWHKASDCEFNDGKTAEEKLGAIKGITTDLNVTVPGYAADATRVSELNNSLNGCFFEQEGTDFYITGADSVRKKLGSCEIRIPYISFQGTDVDSGTTTRWAYPYIDIICTDYSFLSGIAIYKISLGTFTIDGYKNENKTTLFSKNPGVWATTNITFSNIDISLYDKIRIAFNNAAVSYSRYVALQDIIMT